MSPYFIAMRKNHLQLGETKRQLDFPYRVGALGQYSGVIGGRGRTLFPDHLEICLRLASACPLLRHRVGGVDYSNHFPHALVKMPLMEYESDATDEREIFYFIYPKELVVRLEDAKVLDVELAWDIELAPDIVQPLRQIQELMEHSLEHGVADQLDILCFLLLGRLVLLKRRPQGKVDCREEKIRQIASYLQLHFMDGIDVGELAARHGLSRRSFFRHWNQYMEAGPAQYVADLKLKEACRLLLNTDDKISWISAYLKFQEENYFCAIFKRRFGMTPNQYRRSRSVPPQIPETTLADAKT